MRFRVAVLFVSVLAACGGGGSGGGNVTPVATATPAEASVPYEPVQTVNASSWQMEEGDAERNGYQPASTISSGTSANMHLAWSATLDDLIRASPLVSGGRVFVVTREGGVVVLDQTSGALIWSIPDGTLGTVFGTPTIDGNLLIIPVYLPPAVVALNISTGAIVWNRAASDWGAHGPVRTEPLVSGGLVYAGTAGGDPANGCWSGSVAALSEVTGDIIWAFKTTTDGNGIGVWSPLSLTPFGDVVFGTGNACSPGIQYIDSVVALNAKTGHFDWDSSSTGPGSDDDVGGGVAEAGARGFFTGKDGNLYAIDLSNGTPLWHVSLGAYDDFGSIATPTTDGTNVVSQSGALGNGNATTTPQSKIVDYAIDGTLRWTAGPFQLEQFSSPVITNDVVVNAADDSIQIRSLSSGALLWSYDMGSFIHTSPAVVGNQVFIASYGNASTGGTVAAFTTGSQSATHTRRIQVHPRKPLEAFRPWPSGTH